MARILLLFSLIHNKTGYTLIVWFQQLLSKVSVNLDFTYTLVKNLMYVGFNPFRLEFENSISDFNIQLIYFKHYTNDTFNIYCLKRE